MYRPKHFDVTKPAQIEELIRLHSFATLVTHDGAAPFATHMPVLFQRDAGACGTLVTHMARANQQWRHFMGKPEVLVIFHGPHAYVSPSWYESQPAVPTWNYAVVHAYGIPRIVEEAANLRIMLRELMAAFENHRPQPYGDTLTDEYLDSLLPGIVGIEIQITRLEGKFKLSQNRSSADKNGVISALRNSSNQTEREVADLMSRIQL